MSDVCYVCKCPEGYCPPDYYPRLYTNGDVTGFYNTLTANPRGGVISNAIDNSIGRVKFKTVESSGDATAIESIYEPEVVLVYSHSKFYIGLADSYKWVSDNVMEVVYTVDWYTSYILTEKRGGNVRPDIIAKTVNYTRLTGGEFNYLDEGFIPKTVKANKIATTVRYGSQSTLVSLFTDKDRHRVLCYREPMTNSTHWLIASMLNNADNDVEPMELWDAYVSRERLIYMSGGSVMPTALKFNPKGVLFWGYLPVTYQLTDYVDVPTPVGSRFAIRRLHDIEGRTSDTDPPLTILEGTHTRNGNKLSTIYFDKEGGITSTDWDFFRFIDYDGNVIYEFPRGITKASLNVNVVMNYIETAPYISFYFNDSELVDGQFSFSIPLRTLSFFVDSEQVYRAEERTYQKQMRNFQSLNELVSGIVGGVNQGAMISAFSRTQTGVGSSRGGSPQPPLAVNKGIIGGGIGIAGALTGFAYQTLYANKQAQKIEDKRARMSADTLLMSGSSSVYGMDYIGLYEFKYDSATITAISDYHSKFGYQTNQIGTDVVLNNLTGYVQADVIMSKGMRTEVARYVKDMFNYGVTFTVIGGSNGN